MDLEDMVCIGLMVINGVIIAGAICVALHGMALGC
jgi:hypothetical protein